MLHGLRRSVLAAGGGALATAALPANPAYAVTYDPPAARQRIDLNGGWRFLRSDVSGAQNPSFNDSAWSTVTVPHTWNASDGQNGGANYYRGIGWYRRHYTPPTTFAGKKLWLQFAGANSVADVYVNGVHLGQHRGGYGQRLQLRGVNRHQDRLGQGWAISDASHTNDFDLMDEMGVNALRTAHYQQDQKVFSLADERGYVVWTEIPLVNSITDSASFRANASQQLRELIKQNYNHPSIIFWGTGNEQRTSDTATNALLDTLNGIVQSEDPDRLSTYAHNGSITSSLNNHCEVNGYNRYHGWYSGTYNEIGGFLDNLHSSQPTRKICVSEYGAGASIVQHQENPPKPVPDSDWHPEEYQALFHEAHWTQLNARPYLWGTFVWNMFDFAADQRSEGDTYGRNDKGLVTYDRATRKDAFYWYKANWTATPFVYITSRRWTTRTAASINGTVISTKTSSNRIYSWPNIALAPGTNVIEVTGSRAGVTYTDSVTWTRS